MHGKGLRNLKKMGLNRRQLKADLALLGVAFIWGVTFTLVKDALSGIGPYYFLGIRFAAAFGFLALLYWRKLLKLDTKTLVAGIAIGFFLFGGYAFQTVGLKYTDASKAAFITGMFVVFVPLISAVTWRQLPKASLVFGVFSSFLGLGLLSLGAQLRPGYGDVLVLLCALCFALHIIMVGRYAPKYDAVALTLVQIGVVAVMSTVFGLGFEQRPSVLTRQVWLALFITAVPATSIAFLVQNVVQKYTSPTHTSIIFTMEPVFAAIYAYLIGGETFTLRQGIGSLLILVGMLVAELQPGPGGAETQEPGDIVKLERKEEY